MTKRSRKGKPDSPPGKPDKPVKLSAVELDAGSPLFDLPVLATDQPDQPGVILRAISLAVGSPYATKPDVIISGGAQRYALTAKPINSNCPQIKVPPPAFAASGGPISLRPTSLVGGPPYHSTPDFSTSKSWLQSLLN